MKKLLILLMLYSTASFAQDTIPYSTVYLYRVREFSGSLLGLDFNLTNSLFDGKTIGTIRNNSKMVIKIYQEGKNELSIQMGVTRGVFFNAKFGQSYYIKVSLASGIMMARPRLELVDREQGAFDFENITKLLKEGNN
jgi:hypothetical protein